MGAVVGAPAGGPGNVRPSLIVHELLSTGVRPGAVAGHDCWGRTQRRFRSRYVLCRSIVSVA